MANVKSKALKQLISDLQSGDADVTQKALEKVPTKGTYEVIPPLLEVIDNHLSDVLVDKAKTILNDLKSSDARTPLSQGLSHKNHLVREACLSAFWNSSLNSPEYLDLFVKAAIEGTYMEAVEAFTVIENLDGPFQEEQVNDSLLLLKNYFHENPSDDKIELIRSIATVVNRIGQ